MQIEISNQINEIEKAHQVLKEQSLNRFIGENDFKRICIVSDEILTNIITLGYEDNDHHRIHFRFEYFDDGCILEFTDDGIHFNPFDFIQNQPIDNSVDVNKEGGIGLRLVHHLTDQIHYARIENKNNLRLNLKFLKGTY